MNNVEDIYPLSPIQQGMLFHTLYESKAGMYFQQFVCTIQGDLNVPALMRAWQQVADRHPILRTAFIWKGLSEPLQVVRQQIRLPWKEQDWRRLSLIEQQERMDTYIKADREQGFELSKAPLMRMALMQTADHTYNFIWSRHHMLLDRWSRSLVLKEVFAFYEAFCRGEELHLEQSRPYRDYIAWLQQQDLSEAEALWRRTLEGFTQPTLLGVDHPTTDSDDPEASHNDKKVHLSTAQTAALQSFARQHRLTLGTLVQGAWALLLSKYSGERDVVFGITVSGRTAALTGAESMVGPFINTLPVRVRVSSKDSLVCWLRTLQDQQVELLQHEQSPLVEVQGWSEVPRGVPLFESILVFENTPGDEGLREAPQSLEIRDVRHIEVTNYPLLVQVIPGSELGLLIAYDCRRFDAATITRMEDHFKMILEGMVADPERKPSELPLTSEADRHQLLVEWNNTQADYPQDRCIQELFETRVQLKPHEVAVISEEEQLTYSELNRRANQVARYLRKRGVGRNVLVGILMRSSVEMVVGLLAILKAGAGYVPLDPSYPRERLAFMLEDSQAPLLLTEEQLVSSLPAHTAKAVCMDADWGQIARESDENLVCEATPDDRAYVIYTSGSTGNPKGVQINHRSVVNFLSAMRRRPGINPSDRLLSVTTLSFDIAGLELYLPLTVGACVVLASREVASDGIRLAEMLDSSHITVMQATPSTWRLLISAGWQGREGLRILCGGEAVSRDLANQLLHRGAEVWNLYGPTETTIWSTACQIEEGTKVHIGRPIANTQTYLLDSHQQLVPIGVAGELCIGGLGLAGGYLNQPALTAEQFIPNHFSEKIGQRLYRTGDLARYLPDGNIEYLGRLDHQVKLRGFRIELGEIETVLNEHPQIKQSVVIAKEDQSGDKRLVAYLIAGQEVTPSTSELRGYLRERLPEYMVPTAFVVLDELPLTPNGKINRRALPQADESRAGAHFVAPRSPIEETLTEVWAEILGVKEVGVYDNFFELGGHSLKATQVMSQVRETFHIELPMRTLFETPTIAELALAIENARQNGAESQEAIVPVSRSLYRAKISSQGVLVVPES
jgi:amino acid adenylation domain-containing protein